VNRFFKYKLDHAIFWIATVLFYAFTHTYLIGKVGFVQFLLDVIVRNGLLALIIYFHLYYLMPRFLKKRKLLQYVVGVLLAIFFYVLAKNMHDVFLENHLIFSKKSYNYLEKTYYNFSILVFYLLFSLALSLSREWYLQREQLRQGRVEKLHAELAYLRAQTNPHFIFNTLNTIYFQIDKKNEAARETLMLFSNLLRYQLYDCNGNFISIEKEIASLENYVALQKLRKDGNYNVEFICQPPVRDFVIAPLLLMPFVENAFKHISSFSDKQNMVKIEIDKKGEMVYFTVFNTTEASDAVDRKGTGGIGLKNVSRRLQLLYNNKHELDIKHDDQTFLVSLKIDLSVSSFA
jgi:two-component system LytT family sensor kinase